MQKKEGRKIDSEISQIKIRKQRNPPTSASIESSNIPSTKLQSDSPMTNIQPTSLSISLEINNNLVA